MIAQFENLTNQEQELLLKAPALVSVLASCSLNEVNAARKAAALKLAHLRTYKAYPEMLTFYADAENRFETEFEAAVKAYMPFNEAKRGALKKALDDIHHIILKLESSYAQLLLKSLNRYAAHVKKADHSVFEDFVFPFLVPGLTDTTNASQKSV